MCNKINAKFAENHKLHCMNTFFKTKEDRRRAWVHLKAKTKNETDFIFFTEKM